MTPIDIHNTYKQTLTYLSQGKLINAIEKAKSLNQALQSSSLRDELHNLETSYRYMLQYFLEGVSDPDRKSIYNKLIATLFLIAVRLRDELLTRDSSNFEFTQKRYFPFTTQIEPAKLAIDLKRNTQNDELPEMAHADMQHMEIVEANFENALQYIFNYFWLKSTYDSSQLLSIYDEMLSDTQSDSIVKCQLISALTLNLWRSFDETKILMLLDACKNNDSNTQQRALIGLCFVLAKYNRFIPYFPAIRNRLILLTDDNSMQENLQTIITLIIATTETDKITKKLREEIFPEIMKLSPMLNKELRDENFFNTDEWGELNPEWREMIENSGASDKIQELAEMEMSGADVYMSTFSMLKSFPFFSVFSNWFIPFDTKNSNVKTLFEDEDKSVIQLFLNSNVMCNSDRYSFCLSILQMPELQRAMMKQSFGESANQMEEMMKDEALITPQRYAKSIAKHYIQDLFRFFKLNPHRSDFTDMFSTSLIMHKTYLFDLLSSDNAIKQHIADYYFTKKLYHQAIELFEDSVEKGDASATLYQKLGYAYQQTSEFQKALEAYKNADLMQADDFWTNRKIALCYKLTGDMENALKSYQHALFINPENLSIKLQIINCLIELQRHQDALNSVLSLQEEYPNNQKVLRATVVVAFAAKNLHQAHYYASLLIDTKELTARDYMLCAHIAWCIDKNQEAKTEYLKSLQLLNNDWKKFLETFNEDKEYLIANNVDEKEQLMMLDAILYNRPEETTIV